MPGRYPGYLGVEVGRQLVCLVLAGDLDQRDALAQHLEPFAVVALQVAQAGRRLASLQQSFGAAGDGSGGLLIDQEIGIGPFEVRVVL